MVAGDVVDNPVFEVVVALWGGYDYSFITIMVYSGFEIHDS